MRVESEEFIDKMLNIDNEETTREQIRRAMYDFNIKGYDNAYWWTIINKLAELKQLEERENIKNLIREILDLTINSKWSPEEKAVANIPLYCLEQHIELGLKTITNINSSQSYGKAIPKNISKEKDTSHLENSDYINTLKGGLKKDGKND